MDIELVEVDRVRLEQLDVRESDRGFTREGNPQATIALSVQQNPVVRHFVEHSLWGVPSEELCRRELDRRDQAEILRSGKRDLVRVAHERDGWIAWCSFLLTSTR
jgi:hypothetical protein